MKDGLGTLPDVLPSPVRPASVSFCLSLRRSYSEKYSGLRRTKEKDKGKNNNKKQTEEEDGSACFDTRTSMG